jgi:hypothetical protein
MNASALARQRCFHHSHREAVARCTGCGSFFCRECITEHDDRFICAGCLRQLTAAPESRRWRLGWIATAAQCAFGFFLLWFVFYFIGQTLVSIPSAFHEGTLWTSRWWHGE